MKRVLTTVTVLGMLVPTTLAFATTSAPITGSDQANYESNLKIEGIVLSKDNAAPEGQISVTLPTAVMFTVNADGDVITPNTGLSIVNNSSCDIDVKVSKFTDTTPVTGQGITIVPSNELNTKDRSYVSLTLLPQSGSTGQQVELKSENFTSQKLGTIVTGATTSLALVGQAGDATQDSEATKKGLTDSFTLTFTISKTPTTI